jgi:PDZ domain-containing protein/cytochrome c
VSEPTPEEQAPKEQVQRSEAETQPMTPAEGSAESEAAERSEAETQALESSPAPSPDPAPAPTASAAADSGVAGQVIVALILLAGVSVFAFKQSQDTGTPTPTPISSPGDGQGEFQLGLQLEVKEDFLVVREALEGGNAAKAGVRTGDRILAVGGKQIAQEGDSITRAGPILAARSALREGDTLNLTVQRAVEEPGPSPSAPSASPLGTPSGTPAASPEASEAPKASAWGEPFTIVISFVRSEGQGFEPGLAKTLIAKGAIQLLSVRRKADGWWPHYVVPEDSSQERPSVAVSALVAYALRRAEPQLDEAGRSTLSQVRGQLVRALGPDGGIQDKAQRRQHRVYATSLALLALLDNAGKTLPEHAAAVTRMRDWLTGQQVQESLGYDPFDRRYGGWSYHDSFASSGLRTDVSTARYALQALSSADLPASASTWRRAGFFLDVTQNHGTFSRPDQRLHKAEQQLRDGGFSFRPRGSKAGMEELGGALLIGRSYGTATADGLLGLLSVQGIDNRREMLPAPISDARVKAALSWLASNYELGKVPGFGGDPDGWGSGLFHYYQAALCESLHQAGVWKIEGPDGSKHLWAEEVIRLLGSRHGRAGGQFTSDSRLMHEDAPAIAPAFAVIALAAARDRLALAGGLEVERGARSVGEDLLGGELPLPPADAYSRGRELFRGPRCMSCHSEGNPNAPELDGVGAEYLHVYGSRARAELDAFLADPSAREGILGWGKKHNGRRMMIQLADEGQRADVTTYLLNR